MPALLYGFALAVTFTTGIAMMLQPHRQTRAFMHTLEDIQVAGVEYIGEHCGALPADITDAQLQTLNYLAPGFNNQGAGFVWELADHPAASVNVSGNARFLAFLAGRTPGESEADGSYSFIPHHDMTMFRAANGSYNLYAYARLNFSCN